MRVKQDGVSNPDAENVRGVVANTTGFPLRENWDGSREDHQLSTPYDVVVTAQDVRIVGSAAYARANVHECYDLHLSREKHVVQA